MKWVLFAVQCLAAFEMIRSWCAMSALFPFKKPEDDVEQTCRLWDIGGNSDYGSERFCKRTQRFHNAFAWFLVNAVVFSLAHWG